MLQQLATVTIFFISAIADHIQFDNEYILNEEHDVVLRWNIDGEYVELQMSARTTGWVGMGVTLSSNMADADIAFGWVSSGNAHLLVGVVKINEKHFLIINCQDMHGPKYNGNPLLERNQNLHLMQGSESETHTSLIFKRLLKACADLKHDISITDSTTHIIWAFGNSDPNGDVPQGHDYHGGNRGMTKINFFSNNFKKMAKDTTKYEYFYVRAGNVLIPPTTTTYTCNMVQVPILNAPQHIVKFTPSIDENTKHLVHHFALRRCNLSPGAIIPEQPMQCYQNSDFWKCDAILYKWLLGNGEFVFPENVGFPLYPNGVDEPVFFMIDIHYDNPGGLSGFVDNSGIRVSYTSTLRDMDVGILISGHLISNVQVIPPNEKSWLSQGHCVTECMNNLFDNSEDDTVKVIAAHVNGHDAPSRTVVRHIRDKVELEQLFQDNYYDPEYQEMKIFKEPKILRKGDRLITECYYDTTTRDNVTFGGVGRFNETCISALMYYPASSLNLCQSGPTSKAVTEALGVSYPGDHLMTMSTDSTWETNEGKSALRILTNPDNWADQRVKRKLNRKILRSPLKSRCSINGKLETKIYRVSRIVKKYQWRTPAQLCRI